jgi:hypothetical protein
MSGLSPTAATALALAMSSRGPNKGKLLSKAPPSQTLAYAAWQAAMLVVNPYKASIAGALFLSPEQRAVRDEVLAHVDAMPKHERINLDKDRAGLERLGVW